MAHVQRPGGIGGNEFHLELAATAHLGPAKPQVAQGFVFNLDQPQFKDRRVRQALGMLWDYEWSNRQMMRNLYIRQQSFFSNTALAARSLPDAEELKILEPLRGQIPDKVFTEAFKNPVTDGSGMIREQQRQAYKLLQEAGWKIVDDKMVDKEGKRGVGTKG